MLLLPGVDAGGIPVEAVLIIGVIHLWTVHRKSS
eukprot:COSAG01_NODE_465_length_16611_cov_51.622335_2_plen_34_part_00